MLGNNSGKSFMPIQKDNVDPVYMWNNINTEIWKESVKLCKMFKHINIFIYHFVLLSIKVWLIYNLNKL